MSLTLTSTIETRVRRLFLEEFPQQSTDFISDASPDEILDGYDMGCQMQLQVCISNAEATGRLEDHDNSFLQRYIALYVYSINVDQSEYTVPSDVLRVIKFTVGGIRGIRIAPDQDRVIRQWPGYYGSGKGQVQWSLLSGGIQSPPDPDDHTRFLRVYVYGNQIRERVNVPMQAAEGRLVYYRNIRPVAFGSPPATYTDVEDPWNFGPCYWALGQIFDKAQETDAANTAFGKAYERFNRIIPPPQAGPGPQGRAQ